MEGDVYMSEDKILKPKSFRIDDETAEKFKNIAIALGGNQQETLAKLIEAFEFQSGKAVLTKRKAEIEQFEKYVTILTRMYMSSLEDNQNITETVQTKFDALLKSKDTTIQDLQEKLNLAKQAKEDAITKAREDSDENTKLNATIENLKIEYKVKIDDMQVMLSDKTTLNKALTDSCNDLKQKMVTLTHNIEQMEDIKKAFHDLQKEYEKITAKSALLEADLKEERTKHEQNIAELKKHQSEELERAKEQAQITRDKALLELEKKYQEQIQQLKAEKQAEIDKYQQKYFELLEQKKEKENVSEESETNISK